MTTPAAVLFVYGTLKRGERNHRLLRDSHSRGPAVSAPRYRVIDLGPHPGLVHDAATGLSVRGELWAVSAAVLAELDEFEGVPTLFTREPVDVPDFGALVEAYFWARLVPPGAASGDRWPGRSA